MSAAERTPRALRGSRHRAGQLTTTIPTTDVRSALATWRSARDGAHRRADEDDGGGTGGGDRGVDVETLGVPEGRRTTGSAVPPRVDGDHRVPARGERLGDGDDLRVRARRREPVDEHDRGTLPRRGLPLAAAEADPVRGDELDRGRAHATALEHRLGELRPADDEVGEPRVVAVVLQCGPVEPRRVQPRGRGHHGGCGGVPLVLTARVHVGVDLAVDDRHRLRARRAHAHELGAERVRDAVRRRGRARSAHHDAGRPTVRRGNDGWRAGAEHAVLRGEGDGTGDEASAALPQRDVHGPVGAAALGELAGAVERIDDPHPGRVDPSPVVDRLLREHEVVGVLVAQELEQATVREHVRGVAERPARPLVGVGLRAQLDEQGAGLGGVPSRVVVVTHALAF